MKLPRPTLSGCIALVAIVVIIVVEFCIGVYLLLTIWIDG